MPNPLATFALIFLTQLPAGSADQVRIGLFSLLKPEALEVRVEGEGTAAVDVGGLQAGLQITQGECVRLRIAGAGLNVTVSDGHGRVKHSATAERALIAPAGGAALEIHITGKLKRLVRGNVTISARRDRKLQVVLTTSREAAVASVVAAEMSGRSAPEALKALAVVVRTFMLAHSGRHGEEGFEFCDTTHCQVYRGEADLVPEAGSAAVERAVALTASRRLSFRSKPVESYYTAVCGGLSVTPDMIWGGGDGAYRFRRVACRWCKSSRYYRWERAAGGAELLAALSPAAGFRLSQAAEVITENDEQNDFVRRVVVRDKEREAVMTADEFRRAVGRNLGWNTVLSPTFHIERRGRSFIFRGRGFGSQVGLCVAGALEQAASGRSYSEILSFYYPEAEVK